MHETKITPRQRKILDTLSQMSLSRDEISKKLNPTYPVSKTTLFRDLGVLQDLQLVEAKGVGKKTKYISLENPLTRYVDIKEYFKEGSGLRQNAKDSFNFGVFDFLPSVLNEQEIKIAKKEFKKLSNQEQKLDPTIFKREIERFTVEFSWKSSRIEGNTYSLLETDLLIKRMREAVGHPKYEAIMILNHKYAIDYILNHRSSYKILSIKKIVKIHNLITKDLEVSSGIRTNEVAITGTNYVPLKDAKSIHRALSRTVKVINKTEHPIAKALVASSIIAYIQPFSDGNKRTARTLANAILISHDAYPLSYRDLDELDYVQAMLLFYEQNNLYHHKRLFMEQLQFAVDNYFRA